MNTLLVSSRPTKERTACTITLYRKVHLLQVKSKTQNTTRTNIPFLLRGECESIFVVQLQLKFSLTRARWLQTWDIWTALLRSPLFQPMSSVMSTGTRWVMIHSLHSWLTGDCWAAWREQWRRPECEATRRVLKCAHAQALPSNVRARLFFVFYFWNTRYGTRRSQWEFRSRVFERAAFFVQWATKGRRKDNDHEVIINSFRRPEGLHLF